MATENNEYAKYNAENVLEEVERRIVKGRCPYRMRDVCDDLSIFDWWNDTLSMTHLKQMRSFLKAAIERGYTGYVCFKVGASGCSNGMWAHKEETETGYSPDGEFLYRSFTPDYTCWSLKHADGNYYPSDDEWCSCKTVKQLDKLVANINA